MRLAKAVKNDFEHVYLFFQSSVVQEMFLIYFKYQWLAGICISLNIIDSIADVCSYDFGIWSQSLNSIIWIALFVIIISIKHEHWSAMFLILSMNNLSDWRPLENAVYKIFSIYRNKFRYNLFKYKVKIKFRWLVFLEFCE